MMKAMFTGFFGEIAIGVLLASRRQHLFSTPSAPREAPLVRSRVLTSDLVMVISVVARRRRREESPCERRICVFQRAIIRAHAWRS